MVVTTECNGRKVTGVYIGARNARRNFPRETAAVEFELGHLRIDCELKPGFWKDQPRICDSRLCDWLEFKLYRERKHVTPLPLALVHSGRNAYRLRPVILPAVSLMAIGDGPGGLREHHHAAHKPRHLPVHRPAALQ